MDLSDRSLKQIMYLTVFLVFYYYNNDFLIW